MKTLRASQPCLACPIRYGSVCARCDAEELLRLEQAKRYRTVVAGGWIAEAGENLEHFSTIISGTATLATTLEDGRRQIVGLLLPSDFIGRPGRARSVYDVEAVTEVHLCQFERTVFEDLMETIPHVRNRFMTMTLDELEAARAWAVVLGRLSAREKVGVFIARLFRRLHLAQEPASRPIPALGGEPYELKLPLTREGMADFLGLSLETVSRQFSRLHSDGIIEMRDARNILVLRPDLLPDCCDGALPRDE